MTLSLLCRRTPPVRTDRRRTRTTRLSNVRSSRTSALAAVAAGLGLLGANIAQASIVYVNSSVCEQTVNCFDGTPAVWTAPSGDLVSTSVAHGWSNATAIGNTYNLAAAAQSSIQNVDHWTASATGSGYINFTSLGYNEGGRGRVGVHRGRVPAAVDVDLVGRRIPHVDLSPDRVDRSPLHVRRHGFLGGPQPVRCGALVPLLQHPLRRLHGHGPAGGRPRRLHRFARRFVRQHCHVPAAGGIGRLGLLSVSRFVERRSIALRQRGPEPHLGRCVRGLHAHGATRRCRLAGRVDGAGRRLVDRLGLGLRLRPHRCHRSARAAVAALGGRSGTVGPSHCSASGCSAPD